MSVFKPEWIKKYLGKDPTCYIHAGCFDAANAIAFKKVYPYCRVLGFEANPEMFSWMISQKRNETVDVVHAALCAHDGEAMFRSSQSVNGEAGNGSLLQPSPALKIYNPRLVFAPRCLVPAVTLEKYCVHHEITEIDALHLDLQGGEMLALVGFGQMRPKLLYIEHGETEHYVGASSKDSLKIALERLGYRHLEHDGWAGLYQYDSSLKEPLLLSVLIPSIPSRFAKAQALVEKLEAQVGNLPVEIIMAVDNKARSIGEKREMLIQSARGTMLTQVDDDDDIEDSYCADLVQAIVQNPQADLILFNQRVYINDWPPFIVDFDVHHPNEQVLFNGEGQPPDIKRQPWHFHAWRRTLAQQHHMDVGGIEEDRKWVERMLPYVKTAAKIHKVLHIYRFNAQTSEGDQTIISRKGGK